MTDLFKRLVFDMLVKQAISRLFAAAPFLGWGPIGFIAKIVLTKFANIVFEMLVDMLNMAAIEFKNEAHRRAFDDEFIKLKILESSNPSPEEVENALAEAEKRMADFVQHRAS